MAQLSSQGPQGRTLSKLERWGAELGQMHREIINLQRRKRVLMQKFIAAGHQADLNNADLARLTGELSSEAIRQEADKIGSENPRGLKRHRRPADQS